MSAPSTPVRQIVRARLTTPPPAPARPSTRGVTTAEMAAWDSLVAANPVPLLSTPIMSASPSGGSPIALVVTGLSVPPSTPIIQTSQSGLPVAPRRPRVRTLQMMRATWESDSEDEEGDNGLGENGLPMTPPPKRFRYE